ncbi:hypothetical protein [Actinoplanes sp. G11-F43]|uniref:hypothetical protein n=1 Tax=Actinoplanes sp. G11-F43 TaxID=3424130 RepID=UPI003D3329F8
MGIHRTGVSIALAITSITLASCTNGTNQSSAPVQPTAPAVSSQPATPPKEPSGPEIQLPTGSKILVAPVSGSGDVKIPRFKHAEPEYTIYLTCLGGGSVSLRMNDRAAKSWTCDGVPNRHIVIADDPHETGSLTVKDEAQWKLAVIDGAP